MTVNRQHSMAFVAAHMHLGFNFILGFRLIIPISWKWFLFPHLNPLRYQRIVILHWMSFCLGFIIVNIATSIAGQYHLSCHNIVYEYNTLEDVVRLHQTTTLLPYCTISKKGKKEPQIQVIMFTVIDFTSPCPLGHVFFTIHSSVGEICHT